MYLIIVYTIIIILSKNTCFSQNILDQSTQTRYAICLTGQLVRLELGSKIKNLIANNLKNNVHISLFILLDNDISNVKATKFKDRIKPDDALYNGFPLFLHL